MARRKAIYIGGAVAAAALVAWALTTMATSADSVVCSKSRVYDLAKQAVLDQIKTPATAEFQPTREIDRSYQVSPCISTIRAYVDAQNSFGAVVRQKFTAHYIRGRSDGPDMTVIFDPI